MAGNMAGKVQVVVNEKGGVGKTTCSVQIAYELAERGKRVCVIDNDPSGDATTALCGANISDSIRHGNKPKAVSNTIKLYSPDSEFSPFKVAKNLFLMGATDVLSALNGTDMKPADYFRDAIERLRKEFNYIIIDCPPSFGFLLTSAMLASSSGGVLIPMIPEELSFKASKKVKSRIDKMNARIEKKVKILGIFANKVKNNPITQSEKYYLGKMDKEYGSLVFKTRVHLTVKISDAIALQEKVSRYTKRDSKAAQQIASLTDEVIARLEG
ncbi:MAG: ParA family protein [Candidatus Thiodiazotropha endolucinida]|nr:ParA family protein [Candidatus Thiodiazotropha taylori]MCW4225218.1 ParA family protein [Candidatus Thiodiazotropha endolucinida]MCG7880770.1 ParA family protein [Candidatus Thiodiazotropha taylori]MCG7886789.1 ParA family protein [Candidatus Thiodiazotropha taylori]MCG8028176.1 ParA family protein [Candidatus Thiodiazotropha taylori]